MKITILTTKGMIVGKFGMSKKQAEQWFVKLAEKHNLLIKSWDNGKFTFEFEDEHLKPFVYELTRNEMLRVVIPHEFQMTEEHIIGGAYMRSDELTTDV